MKRGAKVQGSTKGRAARRPKKTSKSTAVKNRKKSASVSLSRPAKTSDTEALQATVMRKHKLVTARWLRYVFISVGVISLLLGIIGVVTPVLPTTPFILLSGYCFARGSERFHDWILAHRYFGPMIRAFRDEKRIPLKAKIFATIMIALTMSVTSIFFVKKVYAIVAMASVGVAVVTYIWTFKN